MSNTFTPSVSSYLCNKSKFFNTHRGQTNCFYILYRRQISWNEKQQIKHTSAFVSGTSLNDFMDYLVKLHMQCEKSCSI